MAQHNANSSPRTADLGDRLAEQQRAYAGDEDRPLGGYVGAMATFGAFAAVITMAGASRRKDAPDRFAITDIALTGIATHKISRIISKDSVTSPLRAPFTRYKSRGGPAEVMEEVRGTGVRHAVGELVTCPFCLAPWIATALTGGLVVAPRFTRAVTAVFAAVALSDQLQLVYAQQQQAAEQ
ncbi:MAG: hypothetical protein QOJ90_971 [Actinomycetota bacterium]|jgi:hypothetical protein|nr:hypothetical protein [Actinomycetota bacterium]